MHPTAAATTIITRSNILLSNNRSIFDFKNRFEHTYFAALSVYTASCANETICSAKWATSPQTMISSRIRQFEKPKG